MIEAKNCMLCGKPRPQRSVAVCVSCARQVLEGVTVEQLEGDLRLVESDLRGRPGRRSKRRRR